MKTTRRNLLKIIAAIGLWLLLFHVLSPAFYRFIHFSWHEIDFKMPEAIRSYYLVTPDKISEDESLPLYLFLMGIDEIENPSLNTRRNYAKVAALADKHRIIIAFPRGKPGSFPEIPGVRAWYPEYFKENQAFLASLTASLQKQLPIAADKVVLMGFSNGGYFAGIDILTNPESPFAGYWLDGGAFPYAFNPGVATVPVFLSYGVNDDYNRPNIEKFRQFILANGWKEGENLKTFMHNQGHGFSDEALIEGIKFFSQNLD
jgi:predicted esterase